MTEKKIAVKVDHVSKFFKLPVESTQSLRTALVNRFKGIKGYKEQHVLKDIDFEVEEGDFFGIVGRNGSGKSTLLKIISQIYVPEQGTVTVNGKMVSFIELGVGFNPELTGRENVYMNGAMLGFTTAEVDAMYDEIVVCGRGECVGGRGEGLDSPGGRIGVSLLTGAKFGDRMKKIFSEFFVLDFMRTEKFREDIV